MSETKFVKAVCSKTKRYFWLEVQQFDGRWLVVNVDDLPDESAESSPPKFIRMPLKRGTPCLLAIVAGTDKSAVAPARLRKSTGIVPRK